MTIRRWEAAAAPVLDVLDEDPWVDFARRDPRGGGLPTTPGREVHVAWLPVQPVGLVVLDGGPCGLELTLGVHPEWRRRGIASRLLTFGRQRADATRQALFVQVHVENRPARAFFRGHGLEEQRVDDAYLRFSS